MTTTVLHYVDITVRPLASEACISDQFIQTRYSSLAFPSGARSNDACGG